MSYYVIRLLGAVGLVWDIREPTEKALKANLIGKAGERPDGGEAPAGPPPAVGGRANAAP